GAGAGGAAAGGAAGAAAGAGAAGAARGQLLGEGGDLVDLEGDGLELQELLAEGLTEHGISPRLWDVGKPRTQPQLEVLVLVEQQLQVLQEQQLEQEQLELHQAAESWPRSAMSSTSKVTASSSRSSWPRVWADAGFFFLSSLVVEPVRSGAAHAAGAARTGRERPDDREGPGAPPRRRAAQPPPQPVLV